MAKTNLSFNLSSKIKKQVRNWMSSWSRFWFYSESSLQIQVFRKVFGFLLLGYIASRSLDLEVFYSDRGILTLEFREECMGSVSGVYSLLTYFTSKPMLWLFHISLLCSLLTMALGIYPRISAFVASILHISFTHRNMTVAYGVDAISTYYLVYLCLADGYSKKNSLRSYLSSLIFRFAQIQVCIIYAYSGLMKLGGPRWWRGEAVWDVLINRQLTNWDFSWLGAFPVLITLVTYATILWEVYFPVLVWIQPLKRWVLFGGVMLHLAIGVTLHIPYFASVMVSTYFLFLSDNEIERLLSGFKLFKLHKLKNKLKLA